MPTIAFTLITKIQGDFNGMNFERFEREFSRLRDLFKERGFYKEPNRFEIDLFGRFLDYHSQVIIITSRLEEDIAEHDSFTKYVFRSMRDKKKN